MSEVFVVNASPLIFLGNAGRLDLLKSVGVPRVVVPELVFAEVTGTRYADVAARMLSACAWIERASASSVPVPVIEWDLGPGESAVIALALQTTGARAVLDDLNGRRCARAYGCRCHGHPGNRDCSLPSGQIENPRQVLHELRAAGMWLSDTVINRALQLAGIEV